MSSYQRAWVPDGTRFFTVTLYDRCSDLLACETDLLRRAVAQARCRHPFRIDAWVVLPKHMHCLWTLPPDDVDLAIRWRVIKSSFVRHIPRHESRTLAQRRRGQRTVWQQRCWEHLVRNGAGYRCYFDYIHLNLVKRGLVTAVRDWSFSTFHRAMAEGLYPEDWVGDPSLEVRAAERV